MSFRGVLIQPDPRSPYVLDTHELGRRPGAMVKVERSFETAVEFRTDLIGVPAGAEVELTLRLEAVMEGVLVSGQVYSPLTGQCVRCLDDLDDDIEVTIQELYVYPGRAVHDEETDEDVREIENDLIDLEPAVRDAVVLALPFQPVCEDDCPGLCSQCGQRLADDPGHRHEDVDARWAALGGLLTEGAPTGDTDETKES